MLYLRCIQIAGFHTGPDLTVTAVKQQTCNELIPAKTTAILRGHRSNRITPQQVHIGMYLTRMSSAIKTAGECSLTFDFVQVWFVLYRLTVFNQLLLLHLNKLRDRTMADQGSPNHARRSSMSADFDVGDAKVQHYGLLMKKPFGSQKSGRWQKR